jgi:hypothetical protein
MSEKVCVKVFQYDELLAAAQEKARRWWLKDGPPDGWDDFVLEDAKEIGKLLGIEIDHIYYRGFWSQGDGACFVGTYSYRPGSVQAVKEYAPQDKTLHRIAKGLSKLQRSHFYKLTAPVKHSGHYYHEYCTLVNVYDERDNSDWCVAAETADALTDLLRDFMRWIYRALESAYDDEVSEEQVAESLRMNEYEFFEDGNRAWFPVEIERVCNGAEGPRP